MKTMLADQTTEREIKPSEKTETLPSEEAEALSAKEAAQFAEKEIAETKKERVDYVTMFCLFMCGNLLGVLMEGVFCVFRYGHWETHVVTVWGPYNLLYGFAAAILYAGAVLLRGKPVAVQFAVFAFVATALELAAGLLLEFGMHMRAWDYTHAFLNVRGHICLKMTLAWGALGVAFAHFAVPPAERLFQKTRGHAVNAICAVLTAFMAVNIGVTTISMARWAQRQQGKEPSCRIERRIDEKFNDDFMRRRFIEWRPMP